MLQVPSSRLALPFSWHVQISSAYVVSSQPEFGESLCQPFYVFLNSRTSLLNFSLAFHLPKLKLKPGDCLSFWFSYFLCMCFPALACFGLTIFSQGSCKLVHPEPSQPPNVGKLLISSDSLQPTLVTAWVIKLGLQILSQSIMEGKKPAVKHSYIILDQFSRSTALSVFCLFCFCCHCVLFHALQCCPVLCFCNQ